MAFLTLRRTLLWGVSCSPIVLGLPGAALIARNALGAQKLEVVDASQRHSAERADDVLARAIQIIPTDTSVTDYTYAGCYNDANPASLTPQYLLNAATVKSTTSMSWSSCTSSCSGYQYAGINGGSTCRCGNSFTYTAIVALDTTCSTPCTGNTTQSCGGVNRLTIFRHNNVGNAVSSSRSTSATFSLIGLSPQIPTTLVVSVASLTIPTSSLTALSSSLAALSTSAALPAISKAVSTITTSSTLAGIFNPLAALLLPSPAPILAPLLSSPVAALLPSYFSPVQSPIVATSLANTVSPLPSSLAAAVTPSQPVPAIPLSGLVGNLASQALVPLAPTSLTPVLPLLPLQVASPLVPALSSVLAPPTVPAPGTVSSAGVAALIMPALATVPSAGLASLSPQALALSLFALPTVPIDGLSLNIVPTPDILPLPAIIGPSNVPATVLSIALPLVSQVLPGLIPTATPAIPSLELPVIMSSLTVPSVLGPSPAVPLLQLPLSSIILAPLPLSSELALPEVSAILKSGVLSGASSVPALLTGPNLLNPIPDLNIPINIPTLPPTGALSTELPSSLGESAPIALPHVPVISSLNIPGVQGILPLIPSASIAAQPSEVVPTLNSLPPLDLPSVLNPPANTLSEILEPVNNILPSVAGETPPLSLPGIIALTSLAIPIIPALPSIALPVIPTVPSIAVPGILGLPEIQSLGVPPIALPSVGLPVIDVSSILSAIPTALPQLPDLAETALNAISTSFPSLLQIPNLASLQAPEAPTVLPIAPLDNLAGLPSLVVPPISLPSLDAVLASAVPVALESPILAPSLPIPELSVIPSPAAIINSILPSLVLPPVLAPSPTPRPGIIDQGTVYDDTYTWTFFRNGAVRVDDSYVVPTADRFVGFLPDGTLLGLFVDGLHIGQHLIPYPEAYLSLIIRFHLDVAPLELLDILLED